MKPINAAAFRPLMSGLLVITGVFLPSTALADRFSIVVLPDTQFYPERNPNIFTAQTQWIKNNRQQENIIYAVHLGDIINGDCQSNIVEWSVADTAMQTLDDDGLPYGISPGNHDWDPSSGPLTTICPPTNRNRYNGVETGFEDIGFGPDRFAPLGSSYGSQDRVTNDNNYVLFESNGYRFISINFAYTSENGVPSTAVLEWAGRLLDDHPGRKAIITSHYILEENTAANRAVDGQTAFGPQGQAIFDQLKDRANLYLMLGGHRRGEAWRIEPRDGMDAVHILLSNYQDYAPLPAPDYNNVAQNTCPSGGPGCGNSGFMRILRFDTDNKQVTVTTFAPDVSNPNVAGLTSNRSVDGLNKDTGLTRSTASNLSFEYNAPAVPLPPSNLMIN